MKSWFVVSAVFGLAICGACRFDREPYLHHMGGVTVVQPQPDAGVSDADVPPVIDSGSTIGVQEAGRLVKDAAIRPDVDNPAPPVVDSRADLDSGAAVDSGSSPNDPPPIPMPGGLQCQGVFCPVAVDPAKPCCTTAADIERRTTRAADRCGLDLSPLMSEAYGPGCWQRDQLGIVDEHCPSVEVVQGMPPEPGCCTDEGQCGSLNAEQKLGCRHAPGTERRACADTPNTSACDLAGVYAARIRVEAAWGGRDGGLVGLTDDGRGEISVYLLLSIGAVDPTTRELRADGRVCGFSLPPFYSTTLCESYQPIFPTAIWESPMVPRPVLSGRYECSAAGCNLSLAPYTYLLGFELENPEAPWPSAEETMSLTCPSGRGGGCFPDDDADGRPGVQVEVETSGRAANAARTCPNGYEHRAAPLSANIAAIFDGVRRTDRVLLGARMKVGLSTRLSEDCSGGTGSAVAEYVNSRAYGCLVEPGTFDFPNVLVGAGEDELCRPEESQFLDESLPEYQILSAGSQPSSEFELSDRAPSRGPEASLVRLGDIGDAISCETVRAAAYR